MKDILHSPRWVPGVAAIALFLVVPTGARAQDAAKVLETVQAFLTAMAHRDTHSARQVTLPTGRFTSVREVDGKRVIRSFNMQEDADGWATRPEAVLERIWNPDVRVYGHVAVVTAPYDFYRDGKFSHCGTDVFELLQTEEGWRVSGGTYDVRFTGCAPSPLGPPVFESAAASK